MVRKFKCEECKQIIIGKHPAYIQRKKVCYYCWNWLKKGDGVFRGKIMKGGQRIIEYNGD